MVEQVAEGRNHWEVDNQGMVPASPFGFGRHQTQPGSQQRAATMLLYYYCDKTPSLVRFVRSELFMLNQLLTPGLVSSLAQWSTICPCEGGSGNATTTWPVQAISRAIHGSFTFYSQLRDDSKPLTSPSRVQIHGNWTHNFSPTKVGPSGNRTDIPPFTRAYCWAH